MYQLNCWLHTNTFRNLRRIYTQIYDKNYKQDLIPKAFETVGIWPFNTGKILQPKGTRKVSQLQSHCMLSPVRGDQVRFKPPIKILRTFCHFYNITWCGHTLLKCMKVMHEMYESLA